MSDLLSETLVPLAQIAKMIPALEGKPTHRSTVFRWVSDGRRNQSNRIVRLEKIRIGKYIYTTHEAVARFIKSVNSKSEGE